MTEPAGVTLEMRVPVTPCRARTSLLPDHVVDAKSALRPEALKPTFTGFRVVAGLGSLPRASCATANRASRPRRRLKPPVDLAEALKRAAHQGTAAPASARRPRLAARRHCDEFACARRGNAPVALADGKSVGDFQIPWGAARRGGRIGDGAAHRRPSSIKSLIICRELGGFTGTSRAIGVS
jgi:hypothetical protein